MARPDPDRHDRRQHAPRDKGADRDRQLDEEQKQEEKKETELERAQNRLGNAALSALLGASVSGAEGGGGGGRADLSLAARHADREATVEHGGDADPVDDAPITLEDLTRSWNPRLKKEKDRPEFDEGMPDDALPPEDADWVARVRAAPPPEPGPGAPIDAIVQPSASAIAAGLTAWVRELRRWTDDRPGTRAMLRAIGPSAPCLQDPHGRVSLSRARVGAIATWLLLDAVSSAGRAEEPALARICLELASSSAPDDVWRWAEEHGGDLPLARACLAAHLPDAEHPERWVRIEPRDLPTGAMSRVEAVLAGLVDVPSARTVLPSMPDEVAPPSEDEDDPLGLDLLLAQHTGAAPDPEGALYQTCIAAAEKLAGITARARVRLAGAAAAVARVHAAVGRPAPTPELLDVAGRCDEGAAKHLQLLVEIARAAQRRSVPVRGVRNGLKRAARAIDELVHGAVTELARVVGALAPGVPTIDAYAPREPDAVDVLLREGHGAPDALPSPDRDVVVLVLAMAAGTPAAALVEPIRSAREAAVEARRGGLVMALETCLGPALLWAGDAQGALALASRHFELGVQRRNGIVAASAALLAVEALRALGRPDQAEVARFTAGRHALHWRADGALSLLARWRPPEEELDPRAQAAR